MPESTLDVVIKNSVSGTAAVAEEKAAMSELGGVTATTSEKTKGHATATKEAAAAERDLTKEGGEAARAMGELGSKGGEVFERFSALAGVMGSGGGLGIAMGAALVGVGALIEGLHKVDETYQEQTHSLANLQQAAEATKTPYEELNSIFETFVSSNARFISNENDARNVLASFVRAGFDEQMAMNGLNDALDLASIKNEDLTTAGIQTLQMFEGQGRVAKQLGLDITALKNSDDNAAKAMKDLEKANAEVTKAQDALTNALRVQKEEQDSLHAKKVLSQHDLDVEADKANAVKTAQDNLTKALQGQKTAQDASNGSMALASQVSDQLSVKLDNGRQSVNQQQQSVNELSHQWDQFAHGTGPAVEYMWEVILGTLEGILELLNDIPGAVSAAGGALSSLGGTTGAGAPNLGRTGVRAAGGPVLPGGTYTVGEAGPETLVMGSSGGYVVPGGGGAGGMDDTNELLSAIHGQLASINSKLKGGFSTAAFAARG